MIFDTHAHYDDRAFDGDREELRRQISTYTNEVVAILSKVW